MLNFTAVAKQYEPLVKSEAHRFRMENAGISVEDLEQEALLVVWNVCQKLDPDDNVGGILKHEIHCKMVDIYRTQTTDGRNLNATQVASDFSTSDGEGFDIWDLLPGYTLDDPESFTEFVDLVENVEKRLMRWDAVKGPKFCKVLEFMLEPDGDVLAPAMAAYDRKPQVLRREIVAKALGMSYDTVFEAGCMINKFVREVIAA